jgi:hypothetical protein
MSGLGKTQDIPSNIVFNILGVKFLFVGPGGLDPEGLKLGFRLRLSSSLEVDHEF